MSITERIEKLNKFYETTKSENSRLEGTLEPIKAELMELCGTTDQTELAAIIQGKEEQRDKLKAAIEADLTEFETSLKEYGYTVEV